MHARAARIVRVIALAALLLVPLVTSAATATAAPAAAPTKTVVVLLAPFLTWNDVNPALAPNLYKLAESGAVGNVNPRSATRVGGPSVTRGALTISASAWAASNNHAPSAYDRDESYGNTTAARAYPRFFVDRGPAGSVLFLGSPAHALSNSGGTTALTIGSLGSALRTQGGRSAAVGNSDTETSTADGQSRPAGIVAADVDGIVDAGTVSPDLLVRDDSRPFGVRTSSARLFSAIRGTARDPRGAPSMLVVDVGDLSRASDAADLVTEAARHRDHARAVRLLDATAAAIRAEFPDALLLVVPPAIEDPVSTPAGLAPMIANGAGMDGYLVSSTTHRTGLVTGIDVAPTVLDALSLKIPVDMVGNPMASAPAVEPLPARIALLVQQNTGAITVDTARWGVVNGFILFALVTWLIATFLIVRGARFPRMRSGFRAVVLALLAYPISAWLMFAFVRYPSSPTIAVVLQFAVAAVVWGIAMLLSRRFGPLLPIAFLTGITTVVLLVDQWLGAPLSLVSFFSYSPLLGWRYYGIGNEGAAITLGASLSCIGVLLEAYPDERWTVHLRRWGIPLIGIAVVATAALPTLGANFGMIVWGIAAYAFAWVKLNDRRFDWKAALITVVVIVLVVVGLSVVDVGGTGTSKTHLSRAVSGAEESGISSLAALVIRKVSNNLRILTRTFWAALFAVILVILGWMRVRPQGELKAAFARYPSFTHAFTACFIGGVVGYLTEDSGVVVPAVIMFYAATVLVYLMLLRDSEAPS